MHIATLSCKKFVCQNRHALELSWVNCLAKLNHSKHDKRLWHDSHSVSHWWYQSASQKWSTVRYTRLILVDPTEVSVRPVILIWCCYNSACLLCQISGKLIFQLDSAAANRALEAINFLVHNFLNVDLFTGSIVQSTRRWYLIYPEADFEVFRPTGRHVAPIGVKFGTEEGTLVPSSVPNFTPIGATVRVKDPQNWNFYWDLIKMRNINAPQVRTPCAIFIKFAEFVPRFRMR